MASFKRRSAQNAPNEEGRRSEPAGEPGRDELRRLAESFESHWQDLLSNRQQTTDSECVELLEVVYAVADLHERAKDMRLDFLGYLLGMALQEALEQLRSKEPGDHLRPTAK